MKKRLIIYVVSMGLVLVFVGCASMFVPKSFIRTMEPTWASIEIREDIDYDRAWAMVVDLLARRFDLAVIEKDTGYVRTAWLYTWTGKMKENYRVRVTAKFGADKIKVDVKSEAHFGGPGKWVIGTDTRLLSTLKSDIMGSVGRVAR